MDYTTINNNNNAFLKKNDDAREETDLAKPEKETLETLVEKKVKWSNENEKILVEWGDIAACNKWLHTESCKLFTKHNIYFAIPIIVVSTITGALSFIAAGFKKEHLSTYLQMSVGSANIIVGIMSTVHQFLNIAELKEMHRAAYISWDKLHRNIRVELAKAPDERGDANHFIKLCRQEYDRLTEISPIISPSIIYLFFEIFSGEPGSDQRRRFELLKKPDVCNCITSLDETRLMSFEKMKPRLSNAINTPPYYNSHSLNESSTPNYKNSANKLNNKNLITELDKLKTISDQNTTRRQTISSLYESEQGRDNNLIYSDEFYCSSPAPNFTQFGSRRSSHTKDPNKNKNMRSSAASAIDATINTVKQTFFKENDRLYDIDEESNITPKNNIYTHIQKSQSPEKQKSLKIPTIFLSKKSQSVKNLSTINENSYSIDRSSSSDKIRSWHKLPINFKLSANPELPDTLSNEIVFNDNIIQTNMVIDTESIQ